MECPILRFLGAYGKAPNLKTALEFEFGRNDEVCAMSGIDVNHAAVALIFKKSAVVRKNRGDVWSVRDESGRLVGTRSAVKTHREFWCRGGRDNIKGVVVTRQISVATFETVRNFCAKKNVPLYVVKKNGRYTPVCRF